MKGINLHFPGVTERGEDRTEYGSVVECFRGMEARFEFSWSMTEMRYGWAMEALLPSTAAALISM